MWNYFNGGIGIMTNTDKFIEAVKILKQGTEFSLVSPVDDESGYARPIAIPGS